ncbi:Extracellular solute-binding protein OS=Streptomyces alboniger OX=132473 GN=CP975_09900 PE=4 SV=1 [Streptomyces alboniger]
MGRIGGRIYGIPLERPLPGSTLWLNQGMFADAGMKEGWTAEDFAAVAKRATSGRTYALGAAQGSLFGNGVHSAAHNAPQEWAVTKDGTFQPGWADERFKAAIAFQAGLRKAGFLPSGRHVHLPDRPDHSLLQRHGRLHAGRLRRLPAQVPGVKRQVDPGRRAAVQRRR